MVPCQFPIVFYGNTTFQPAAPRSISLASGSLLRSVTTSFLALLTKGRKAYVITMKVASVRIPSVRLCVNIGGTKWHQ